MKYQFLTLCCVKSCTNGSTYRGGVIDPFAGGSVRGVVADKLGYNYTGIELRKEQVDANILNAQELECNPKWICDDSLNIDKYIDNDSMDMVFTCPPYADLEVYSDDERDISTMKYDKFIDVYGQIMRKTADKLKQNRFFVVVVGECRDKHGVYYNFVSDTISILKNAGLKYYNEIILQTAIGTLPIRAVGYMNKARKIGKRHQNVLVFYKGDPKEIKNVFGEVINKADIEEIE